MYVPQRGFAQSKYYDQQATAIAGMLAFASDYNLVDSAYVKEAAEGQPPAFLAAGRGVVITPNQTPQRQGINMDVASLPTTGTTAAQFGGVIVRNQQMAANETGESGWYQGTVANFARPVRAGSRIWVQLSSTTNATAFGGAVYWVVDDAANEGKEVGTFQAQASATAADTVELTGCRFLGVFTYDGTTCNNIALIEMGL